MRSWLRKPIGAVLVAGAVFAGAGAITYPIVTGGGGAPAGTANLWVDTNGGTCTRQASPAAYNDAAACASLDAAQDASNAGGGDTVRVKNGTYTTAQNITGAKTSTVTYIGESKAGVVFTQNADLEDRVELQNMTFENDSHGNVEGHPLASDGYDNVTLRDVDILGDYAYLPVFAQTNFTWIGGRLGDYDGTINKRWCGLDQVPFFIGGAASNTLVEGVQFSDALPSQDGENGCSGDNVHLEIWRMDGASSNITMRRNTIDLNHANSAVIFISAFNGGSPSNVKIVGNVIGPGDNVGISAENTDCSTILMAYNTFRGGSLGNWLCTTHGEDFVGNLSAEDGSDPTCANATFTANVIVESSPRNCNTGDDSGNTWLTGSGTSSLGFDTTGHLQAGSPAINAAETPGPSDVCTDTSIMGTLGDIDGDPRPTGGSKCDAGADEYTAG